MLQLQLTLPSNHEGDEEPYVREPASVVWFDLSLITAVAERRTYNANGIDTTLRGSWIYAGAQRVGVTERPAQVFTAMQTIATDAGETDAATAWGVFSTQAVAVEDP